MKSIKSQFTPDVWCLNNQHTLNNMLGQIKNKHSPILYSVQHFNPGLSLTIYEALYEIN